MCDRIETIISAVKRMDEAITRTNRNDDIVRAEVSLVNLFGCSHNFYLLKKTPLCPRKQSHYFGKRDGFTRGRIHSTDTTTGLIVKIIAAIINDVLRKVVLDVSNHIAPNTESIDKTTAITSCVV